MSEPSPPPAKIKFDYIKSNLFRTTKADGVILGANGQGDIIINLFSERSAIPQRSVHLLVDNRLSDEITAERVARDAIVREVEISVSMSLRVAKSFATVLQLQIKMMEEQAKKFRSGAQK